MRVVSALIFVLVLAAHTVGAREEAKAPPEGWKEFTSKANSFSCWVPEDKGRLKESFRDHPLKKGQALRFSTVAYEVKDGPSYRAGTVTLMPYAGEMLAMKYAERVAFLRDLFAQLAKAKPTDEKEINVGRVPGKEFVLDTDGTLTRHRIYAYADRFFIMSVSGTKEQVESKKATTFLDSYKIPERYLGTAKKDKDKDK